MPTNPKQAVRKRLERFYVRLSAFCPSCRADSFCVFIGKTSLLKRFKLMLPVQSPSQKYFCSHLAQITSSSLPSRPTHKGRFAIVTNVGHGMRWTRWHQRRMVPFADGGGG